jgi:VIT1/CCC1 family predicted Fe2+/Mn2+ transporter
MTASRLMENPDIALSTLVKEELGLDPAELGSPWGASIGSFLAFAAGAIVPVIPFLFAPPNETIAIGYVIASATMALVALFGVGAALSLFTGRSALWSGFRQAGLGAVAAALTYAIGRVIGVSTGV